MHMVDVYMMIFMSIFMIWYIFDNKLCVNNNNNNYSGVRKYGDAYFPTPLIAWIIME